MKCHLIFSIKKNKMLSAIILLSAFRVTVVYFFTEERIKLKSRNFFIPQECLPFVQLIKGLNSPEMTDSMRN